MGQRRLSVALAALAVIGLAIAGYLTVVHYQGGAPVCPADGAGAGCGTVAKSRYAELLGVPVSLWGLVGYGLLLAGALLRGESARLTTMLIAFVGVGFSAYLTYLELFVIDAICMWCVASAVCMVALAVLASVRWWRGDPATD